MTVQALAADKPFCWCLPMGSQPESTDEVLTDLHDAGWRHLSVVNQITKENYYSNTYNDRTTISRWHWIPFAPINT